MSYREHPILVNETLQNTTNLSNGGVNVQDSSSLLRLDPAVLATLVGTLVGLWLLGLLVSTRCGRRCRYDGRYDYNDGAWAVAQRNADREVALRLQSQFLTEEEEEAKKELARKKKRRSDFVREVLSEEAHHETDHYHDTRCAICLNDYVEGDNLAQSTSKLCDHKFHGECIANWLVLKTHCPICRETFLMEDIKKRTMSLGQRDTSVTQTAQSTNQNDQEDQRTEAEARDRAGHAGDEAV